MKSIAIIPARYASTRFPGKPLADLGGKSMIRRVYERAASALSVDEVMVATDDERILRHVRDFGGQVRLTDPAHPSGTDRCAEVARLLPAYDVIINVQGDEPFIQPSQIDQVIQPLTAGDCPIATLARPIRDRESLFNSHVVKVVVNSHRQAMYFSRHPIPFVRQAPPEEWLEKAPFYQHLGLYAFRRATLLEVTALPPSAYEQAESLEQLRWLEAGYSIAVEFTEVETLGIDTPEDLERARGRLEGLSREGERQEIQPGCKPDDGAGLAL